MGSDVGPGSTASGAVAPRAVGRGVDEGPVAAWRGAPAQAVRAELGHEDGEAEQGFSTQDLGDAPVGIADVEVPRLAVVVR